MRVGPGHERGEERGRLPRLRVRQAQRRRPGLRRLLRRRAARDRQPGRPLARGQAARRGRRAAQHRSTATGRCTSRTSTTRCIRCRRTSRRRRRRNALWQGQPADAPKPMAMEQILPFGAGYDFFDRWAGASTPTATACSASTSASTRATRSCRSTRRRCARRTAPRRARARSCSARRRTRCCFPSLAVKGSPQAIRVIRPLAADRTLVEAWSFRAEGAPDLLFERSMTYNRLVFSPMSVVAHDDVHLFESIQQGLRARRQRMGQPAPRLRSGRARDRHATTSTAPTSC